MQYKLTCLTPTLIGDGQELAPVDYMVWKDRVNVLDQRRIFKLFARGSRLEGYLSQIKQADKLDFASWGGLAQSYAGRRIAFSDPGIARYFERAAPQDLFIRTFATSPSGGLYVPGSAIKAGLRTGAMYTGLRDEHWARVTQHLDERANSRRAAHTVEDRAVRGQLKGFMVSDSMPVPVESATLIYLLRTSTLTADRDGRYDVAWKHFRGSAQRPTDSLPVFAEMAKPGTAFTGTLRDGGTQAFDSARKFAEGILKTHLRYAQVAGIPEIAGASQALLDRAASLTSNQCLLPLGWGAGILGKAAVADASPDAIRNVFRKLSFYGRAIQTGMPFPKTRRIVFLKDEPFTLPGWTLLET